jgi:hypothetical protein
MVKKIPARPSVSATVGAGIDGGMAVGERAVGHGGREGTVGIARGWGARAAYGRDGGPP